MNPPSDFENQLRELRPQPPGPDLRQRIAQQGRNFIELNYSAEAVAKRCLERLTALGLR